MVKKNEDEFIEEDCYTLPIIKYTKEELEAIVERQKKVINQQQILINTLVDDKDNDYYSIG